MSFESNLKYQLQKENIKQKELLVKILKNCKEKNYMEKAEVERSNFNNMIKGNRPFPQKYIIEIEKILGIRFADLYDDNKVINKKYELKGIRYIASLDDYSKYKELLEEELPEDDRVYGGYDLFFNTDEYDNSIFHYIYEYGSKEGLKFVIDELKLKCEFNGLSISKNGSRLRIDYYGSLDMFEMICGLDDKEFFNKVFGIDNIMNCGNVNFVSSNDLYKKILLTENILYSLTELYEKTFAELNRGIQNNKNDKYYLYNPLLFEVIDYALKNSKDYKEQIRKIIDLCINQNDKIIENIKNNHNYKYTIHGYDVECSNACYGNLLNIYLKNYPGLSDELVNAIKELNEKAKKVEEKPKAAFNENSRMSESEFIEAIDKYSNIDNYFRDNEVSFKYISDLLEETNCKIDKIGDKLYDYFIKKKSNLDKNSNNYERDYQKISFAISFVELYKDKLNNL